MDPLGVTISRLSVPSQKLVQNSKLKTKNSNLDWLLLSLLIFIPRLLNLDVFLTADEPLFLVQARQFGRGLASGDLNHTLGIGYPGVTVAWWSAPVVNLAQTELGAYVAGRLATAVATGLLLLLLYGLSRSLLGRWPAFIAVALLALDPYSLAYGRLLHIEASLALFMVLTGVAYLRWLHQAGRRWLLLAGFFAGLALLTKSTALLLGPMLVAGLAGWGGLTGLWRDGRWWLRQFGALLLIGLVAVVTFTVLWPAMWVHPAAALSLTFGKLFTDQEAGAGNLGMFWLGQFVEDPGPAFYPVAFLLKATPWLLFGLVLNLVFTFNSKLKTQHSKLTSIFFWLFALTYLVLMTLASKKSIRYMLPAFPVFYLLAGQAFYQLGVWANSRMNKWQNERLSHHESANGESANGELATSRSKYPELALRSPLLAFHFPLAALRFTLITLLILFTFFYHPYYFTYYNPLLLGWRWAPQTILVGWGEGLDQAARYLNTLPSATVSAWYEWLFPVFYQGQTEPVVPPEHLLTADHAVLYINQVQRNIPDPNIIHYFRTRRQPEQTVRLAGIDYAWVYPGPIVAQGVHPDPSPQYPLGGDFGGEVQLLGYKLHPQAQSGQPLIVTLYWRVQSVPPGERFVFVRLVDQAGRIWAKSDSPPVMGLWPVERWQPGMLIEDAQALLIPPGTPPGQYRLEVGWYEPTSGQPLPASGQPVGQGGGLLLGEVEVAWQPSTVAPDLPHQTDTRLAPNARLIGYDVPPAAATGDILPLRLSWREAKTLSSFLAGPNDWVLFEWRADGKPVAKQLDQLPWPVDQWGRGATLLSQHDLLVPPSLTSGRYEVTVSLHTGSDPAGEPFSLGSVEVIAPPHQFELPVGATTPVGPAQLAQNVTLAGYKVALVDQALALHLYWRAEAPLTTRYRVFAQLLAGDNRVMAQSDSFPAAGQRPTTGWLPGEVISDTHTLPLSPELPPGQYRLIAGLYQPLTGERLPVVAGAGNVLPDAILLTEVALP